MESLCKNCRQPFDLQIIQIPEDRYCDECRTIYGDYLMLTWPVIAPDPETQGWQN